MEIIYLYVVRAPNEKIIESISRVTLDKKDSYQKLFSIPRSRSTRHLINNRDYESSITPYDASMIAIRRETVRVT